MGKVPIPVLKELEYQTRQNLSAFVKTSSCNTTMEKCQHSLKLTFKKVKTPIPIQVPILRKQPGVVMTMPVTILRLIRPFLFNKELLPA